MKWIGYAFTAVLGLVFLLLGMFNIELVSFNYLFASAKVPLVVVMMGCVVFGALWVLVVLGFRLLYWRNRAHRLQAQILRERQEQHRETIAQGFARENASHENAAQA